VADSVRVVTFRRPDAREDGERQTRLTGIAQVAIGAELCLDRNAVGAEIDG
jgi:hypothetical protein